MSRAILCGVGDYVILYEELLMREWSTFNFVRGSTIPISLSFLALKPYLGTVGATQLVGVVCFSLAAIGLYSLRESFAVDLNFLELLRPANSIPEEETEEVRSVGNL